MILTQNLSKDQEISIRNYKKVGIEIRIEDDTVIITQVRLINGYILNQKELHERAREIFPSAKIKQVVFSLDLSIVTVHWIQGRMEEFGIKRNDLIRQLALDKSYISRLFSNADNANEIELSRQVKAMFIYYFLTYQLNRDFREYLND